MALSARCDMPRCRNRSIIMHAKRNVRFGVPILPSSLRNGSRLHVPSDIHECSRRFRTGRASSCDEYVDSMEIVGDGVGCCD